MDSSGFRSFLGLVKFGFSSKKVKGLVYENEMRAKQQTELSVAINKSHTTAKNKLFVIKKVIIIDIIRVLFQVNGI